MVTAVLTEILDDQFKQNWSWLHKSYQEYLRAYQTDLFATGWLIGRCDVWYRRIGDANDGWAAWSFDITVDQGFAWAFFWAAEMYVKTSLNQFV